MVLGGGGGEGEGEVWEYECLSGMLCRQRKCVLVGSPTLAAFTNIQPQVAQLKSNAPI